MPKRVGDFLKGNAWSLALYILDRRLDVHAGLWNCCACQRSSEARQVSQVGVAALQLSALVPELRKISSTASAT